jgi:DNA invertase Pin-like site-specific DNA recombinase
MTSLALCFLQAAIVAYYRVSTVRQERSGLGLEAQKAAVLAFINGNTELLAEFTEVESGKLAGALGIPSAIMH